jgi:hypothetical protein
MARVYVCRYGLPLSKGIGLGELPLAECISKLAINKTNYIGATASKVAFGSPNDALARIVKGFGHVVVLVAEPEASKNGWTVGYYLSSVPSRAAAAKLGKKLPPPPDPTAEPAPGTPAPPPPPKQPDFA